MKRRKIGLVEKVKPRPLSVKELFKIVEDRKARLQEHDDHLKENPAGGGRPSVQGEGPQANQKMVRQNPANESSALELAKKSDGQLNCPSNFEGPTSNMKMVDFKHLTDANYSEEKVFSVYIGPEVN